MQPWLVQFETLAHGASGVTSMGWETGFSIWLIVCTAAGAAMCSAAVVYFDRRVRPECPILGPAADGLRSNRPPDALTPRELVILLHSVASLELSDAGATAAGEYIHSLRAQLLRWECQPARSEAHRR